MIDGSCISRFSYLAHPSCALDFKSNFFVTNWVGIFPSCDLQPKRFSNALGLSEPLRAHMSITRFQDLQLFYQLNHFLFSIATVTVNFINHYSSFFVWMLLSTFTVNKPCCDIGFWLPGVFEIISARCSRKTS